MAITNEQAMQALAEASARRGSSGSLDAYWHGAFIGMAGAYLLADVITLEQYMQLTEPETATA